MSDCMRGCRLAYQKPTMWGGIEWHEPIGEPKVEMRCRYDSGPVWEHASVLAGRTLLDFDLNLPQGHPPVRIRVNGEPCVIGKCKDWDDLGVID